MLTGNPNISRLHVLPNKPRVRDLLDFRRAAHQEQYEIAIDLQGLFLSGLLSYLSGAPTRIGLDGNREFNSLFMTRADVPSRGPLEQEPLHAVDVLGGFLTRLGAETLPIDFPTQYYLSATDSEGAVNIEKLTVPRAVFNVGASSLFKQWPAEHWADLLRNVITLGHNVVFIGDQADRQLVLRILGNLDSDVFAGRILNLAGETTLESLPSIINKCSYMVTGDTGPMHIAVAVGTPVVALFGATDPRRTGPYGTRNIVIDKHIACSPCFRNPTCNGRVDCMQAILPQDVMTSIMEVINRSAESSER